MPTVIESLVITLGLDPKNLNDGQKRALSDWKKFQDEQRRGAKEVESNNKKVNESFGDLGRQVLGLYSLFIGGRGIKDFVEWQTKLNIVTGRMSANLNIGVGKLNSWMGVSERAGGSAEATANSFQSFSDQIQSLKVYGEASFLPFLRAIESGTGKQINLNKPLTETYVDLAEALQILAEKDRTNAVYLGKQILGDEALVTLMIEKGRAVQGLIEKQNQLNGVTKEDIEASKQLNAVWKDSESAAAKLGRTILTSLTPALVSILKDFKYMFSNAAKGEIPETSPVGVFLKLLGRKGPKGVTRKEEAAAEAKEQQGSSYGDGGFGGSQADKEAFIRAEAKARGIDPDVAMKVARSEGFNGFKSSIPGERSYGAFQLNYSKNPNKPSLGDLFTKETGKDASDPNNEKAGIRYALDNVAKSGWGQWYGARAVGVGNFDGLAGARPLGSGNRSAGAGGAGSTEVNIGTIKIETRATDAEGIAKDIRPALERNSLIANANYGQR